MYELNDITTHLWSLFDKFQLYLQALSLHRKIILKIIKAKQMHLDSYCISKTTKQNVAQCEIPFLAHLHCEQWCTADVRLKMFLKKNVETFAPTAGREADLFWRM